MVSRKIEKWEEKGGKDAEEKGWEEGREERSLLSGSITLEYSAHVFLISSDMLACLKVYPTQCNE